MSEFSNPAEPSESTITEASIRAVISSILSGYDATSQALFRSVVANLDLSSIIEALDNKNPSVFHREMIKPFHRIVEAMLDERFEDNTRARALFEHAEFFSRHFRFIIERFEGSSCCADKTATVMAKLAHHLIDGTPITFNYKQEYTYHLPTTVFTKEAEIVEFFQATHHLMHGQPLEYIRVLGKLATQADDKTNPPAPPKPEM
jgi:hypothetical protein